MLGDISFIWLKLAEMVLTMNRSSSSITLILFILILGVVVLLSVGQVLFKYAAREINFNRPETLLSPILFIALVIYGAATLGWLYILSRAPLSLVFPFYGMVFLFVPLLSWAFLRESITISNVMGSVVIAVGVAIVAFGGRA